MGPHARGGAGEGAAGCLLGRGVGDVGERGVREGRWRRGRGFSGMGNRSPASADVAKGKERVRVWLVGEGSYRGKSDWGLSDKKGIFLQGRGDMNDRKGVSGG